MRVFVPGLLAGLELEGGQGDLLGPAPSSAALPASWSARSLPGTPEWPFTHWMPTVRESRAKVARRDSCTRMAVACPRPTPVWVIRVMALVESEWMIIRWNRRMPGADPQWRTTSSIAVISASKAVWWAPSTLDPEARAGPAPSGSALMSHPAPAEYRYEPSVHA